MVAEFHHHDQDQPDQFHFSWSDQTREPRRNRLELQLQWVVRIPESMLLLYSERPTQANPNRRRLPATVIAEQDRRFLLVRERGPAPQPAGWGD